MSYTGPYKLNHPLRIFAAVMSWSIPKEEELCWWRKAKYMATASTPLDLSLSAAASPGTTALLAHIAQACSLERPPFASLRRGVSPSPSDRGRREEDIDGLAVGRYGQTRVAV